MNRCSKKLCPMQVGTTDNCKLTKEECPYYTQRTDYQEEIQYFKFLVLAEIFFEIDKLLYILEIENGERFVCIDHNKYLELKKKYPTEKGGAEECLY